MEIILVLVGIFILGAFLFILIEYPYYLVSLFVFLHLYGFNIELSGPLDLRGLISVVLFIRLVIFDKKNLDLIRQSLLSNKFFILIIVFSFYSASVDFFANVSLILLVKPIVLNVVALLLGFITIINGYGKKTIVIAILITGVFATGDLIYSYFIQGTLRMRRIMELAILGQRLPTMNHNFFGDLCGYALITAFLLIVTKNVNKIIAYVLITVFSLGTLISTSRGSILSVLLTLVVILLTQKALEINFKKLFFSGVAGVILILIVALSYSFILSAMNIKSEFSEQIYWRLVEEPLSIFDEDIQEFGGDNNKVQGSMRWRFYKYQRDADVFFSQNIDVVIFGFGTGGYSNIGEINYDDRFVRQYTSHNFYINLISENGIAGLLLFLSFFFSLMYSSIKMIRNGWIQFSLVYLLFALFFGTIGDDPRLIDKFSFILYGGIIAELLLVYNVRSGQVEIVEPRQVELVE